MLPGEGTGQNRGSIARDVLPLVSGQGRCVQAKRVPGRPLRALVQWAPCCVALTLGMGPGRGLTEAPAGQCPLLARSRALPLWTPGPGILTVVPSPNDLSGRFGCFWDKKLRGPRPISQLWRLKAQRSAGTQGARVGTSLLPSGGEQRETEGKEAPGPLRTGSLAVGSQGLRRCARAELGMAAHWVPQSVLGSRTRSCRCCPVQQAPGGLASTRAAGSPGG